jgi:hypothetical protein
MDESDVPELLRLMRAIVSFECGQDFNLNEAKLLRRGFGERPESGAYVVAASVPFTGTLQQLKYPARQAIARSLQGGLTTAR